MKFKIQYYVFTAMIVLMSTVTAFAQEDATEAVDGNTRGIMLLVLLLGFGIVSITGFVLSAMESQEDSNNEEES